MLLNRCLTVQVNRPDSHQGKGWEQITDAAVRALNARTDEQGRPKPLVAILWGRKAQTLAPLLPIQAPYRHHGDSSGRNRSPEPTRR